MKFNIIHLNVRSLQSLDSWVERQILSLGATRHIEEANIRLIRLRNESPAYQVNVHLVTPGPDVFGESRDHTLRAAFTKVMKQLQNEIARRKAKRVHRIKSNLSLSGETARRVRHA